MASVRQIARRIRSVENTAKITKAMSMIAASKLRRSQDAATQGRSYAENMAAIVSNVVFQVDDEESRQPLLESRSIKTTGIAIIAPDRGLTGGLKANILRSVSDFIKSQSAPVKVVAVGKKSLDFARRNNLEIIAEYTGISDRPSPGDTLPIAGAITEAFSNEIVDSFHLIYAQFVNTTLQRPVIEPLLPVIPSGVATNAVGYIFEPNAAEVLGRLLPRYVETLVHHAVLEGNASEQSARMVAMNQATDNANEMVEDLTLLMNKLRQEKITTELLDIVGGVAALES
ncbi:MAG TPA: ATP synthase F1 subunit gamma [Dehalococcoidia bacterium]|jgi:F-type H+-transporting ATPase subunit gamma|nr:ATP synthase F1 subunit gamma [Dehalococcoidia bacterium]